MRFEHLLVMARGRQDATTLGMVRKHPGIGPQGVLRTQADFASAPGALQHGHGLPDLGHITALEANGANQCFTLKIGTHTGNPDTDGCRSFDGIEAAKKHRRSHQG